MRFVTSSTLALLGLRACATLSFTPLVPISPPLIDGKARLFSAPPLRPGGGSFALLASSGDSATSAEEEARRLREQAERLRREVADVERSKQEVAKAEREESERTAAEKRDVRMRYSAEVPILKGDGSTVLERVDFPPRIAGGMR
uniref:Uncharacterized protein n=1 Tax=Trieres chinensis TaxID=1514140 RepID=A0A7S1ZU86_TRICV